MSQRTTRLFASLGAALAVSACSIDLSAERLTRSEERRFAVTGRPEVSLKTFDGAIRVRSWDKPEVLVTIERQAGNEEDLSSLEVKAEQEGNRITVDAVQPPSRGMRVGVHIGRSVNLTVSVPRETMLSARTGDGSVEVDDVAGRVDVTTGDGAVLVRGVDGELSARTGDGNITVERLRGAVNVVTGDGHVKVGGVLRTLQARSGDGSIEVRAEPGSATASDWSINSGDGSVTVHLPDGFAAELQARSGDGTVSVSGLEVASPVTREDGREMSGRLGSGGSRLTIRTGDGSITVRKI